MEVKVIPLLLQWSHFCEHGHNLSETLYPKKKVSGYHQLFGHQQRWSKHLLCSTEERNSYRFGECDKDDSILIFGWKIIISPNFWQLMCALWLISTERYVSVQYGMQLLPFSLSEVVNDTKKANHTIPIFWYPSIGVPSTVVRYLKGGARLTAEGWLVDRESSHNFTVMMMSEYCRKTPH